MSKIKISIWNRTFELSVCKECYPGENETEEQNLALEAFLATETEIAVSEEKAAQYILKSNPKVFSSENIDNIFKYIMPKSIYIPRKNGIAVIMCDYKFDIEHGLAVVFENGKYKTICPQDEVI